LHRVWQEIHYRINICRVTKGGHIEHLLGRTGALSYKPEGRGIDPRWCHWNFTLI
jgi:hypothetical protein